MSAGCTHRCMFALNYVYGIHQEDAPLCEAVVALRCNYI